MAQTRSSSRSSGSKRRRRKKSSSGQPLVFWLALIVFLGSSGYLMYDQVIAPMISRSKNVAYQDSYSGDNTVTGANDSGVWENTAISLEDAEPERLEDGTLKSFAPLLEMNSDIIGWITVPNSVIDYPVVQTTDNDYYLHKNINKEDDKNGTIFADFNCQITYEQPCKNIVLYGHHMKSGNMFQNLMKYCKVDYYRQNPVIRFNTKYDEAEWVVFAVMKLNTRVEHGPVFNFMRSTFSDDQDFSVFIEDIRKRSIIDTYDEIDVAPTDELLTLSTCSYEYADFRTVVVARKVREGETTIDVSTAHDAENPLMPEIWNK